MPNQDVLSLDEMRVVRETREAVTTFCQLMIAGQTEAARRLHLTADDTLRDKVIRWHVPWIEGMMTPEEEARPRIPLPPDSQARVLGRCFIVTSAWLELELAMTDFDGPDGWGMKARRIAHAGKRLLQFCLVKFGSALSLDYDDLVRRCARFEEHDPGTEIVQYHQDLRRITRESVALIADWCEHPHCDEFDEPPSNTHCWDGYFQDIAVICREAATKL